MRTMSGDVYGYARVSTKHQGPDRSRQLLRGAGREAGQPEGELRYETPTGAA